MHKLGVYTELAKIANWKMRALEAAAGAIPGAGLGYLAAKEGKPGKEEALGVGLGATGGALAGLGGSSLIRRLRADKALKGWMEQQIAAGAQATEKVTADRATAAGAAEELSRKLVTLRKAQQVGRQRAEEVSAALQKLLARQKVVQGRFDQTRLDLQQPHLSVDEIRRLAHRQTVLKDVLDGFAQERALLRSRGASMATVSPRTKGMINRQRGKLEAVRARLSGFEAQLEDAKRGEQAYRQMAPQKREEFNAQFRNMFMGVL